MLKRLLDILLSLLGISITLPFLPVLALLIKLDSKGPVFYLCDRIGKAGKPFKMYKFRTMYETPVQIGPNVCPQDDPRVTPLGRFLRRAKLNELPQLLNILKGDMTFVGPRPEALDLAALYPQHAQAIFTVKPGLVGPNQILGRNEEEWYPPGVDPQQYYIEEILPKKLPIDLEYVRQSSVVSDLKYILLGVKETLFKALNWKFVLQNRSQIYLLFADLVLSLISFVLAHVLRFDGLPEGEDATVFVHLLFIMVFVRIPSFMYCGLYGTLIRYLSLSDIIGMFKAISMSTILLMSLALFLNLRSFSRSVLIID
jgi:lipopolysaccharide/colanic/teichoic acid biosynthesis glycosyltransferase